MEAQMLNHLGTLKIETDRLILRKAEKEDYKEMYENWASDSEVTKYTTWPSHKNHYITQDVLKTWTESYFHKDYYQWVICLKEDNVLIGSISIMNIDEAMFNCEVGYCIGKKYWNSGITTEAFKSIIKIGFEEIGFERITARHDVDNTASGRVMVKCGLKYEGTLRRILKNNKGELVDCKYYSILKDEYKEHFANEVLGV
jgi:ribosomal-protein-alanine N-acetyltransferase